MRNVIQINPMVRAFAAAELGDQIARGLYKQVGIIRTEYVTVVPAAVGEGTVQTVTGRSIEAVIYDMHLDKLYAVEQHRGVAIRAEIGDEEMLRSMKEIIPTLAEGEGFTYDQRITNDVEDIDNSKALDVSDIDALDGTEGL